MPVTWFAKYGQPIIDLLFPPRCLHCKTGGQWLCKSCQGKISFISPPICNRCGTPLKSASYACHQCRRNPLDAIDGIRVVAYFENNPIRPAIHHLKYQNLRPVAADLAQLLTKSYRQYNLTADVIVPVPLHRARQRERGYNQSDLLANHLGQQLALPVNTEALQRTRHTKSQMTLGAEERRQNVSDAFICPNTQVFADKTIILLDDVCTTGSTLDACAIALKSAGAAAVWGLTLAKAQ